MHYFGNTFEWLIMAAIVRHNPTINKPNNLFNLYVGLFNIFLLWLGLNLKYTYKSSHKIANDIIMKNEMWKNKILVSVHHK